MFLCSYANRSQQNPMYMWVCRVSLPLQQWSKYIPIMMQSVMGGTRTKNEMTQYHFVTKVACTWCIQPEWYFPVMSTWSMDSFLRLLFVSFISCFKWVLFYAEYPLRVQSFWCNHEYIVMLKVFLRTLEFLFNSVPWTWWRFCKLCQTDSTLFVCMSCPTRASPLYNLGFQTIFFLYKEYVAVSMYTCP